MANNMNGESKGYVIANKELLCPICKCHKFYKKNIKLNTTIASLVGIEENLRSIDGYICSECNHIVTFVSQ
ncbi:MAG: hypothetical protein CMA42_02730 [Euryarchaeota archaeon]|nr:hypothetical protein [Euryarchaeota archaeon]